MQYSGAAWILAAILGANTAIAEEKSALTIISKPGSSNCQSTSRQLGDATSKVELCVTGGSFAHDVYTIYIDRKIIAHGIDDETTSGVSGLYHDEKVSLVCTPQNEPPKTVSPEDVATYQETMHLSAEDARKMAIASNTVEVGRLCKAQLADKPLIEVQVVFQ